ncbi:uncharacterized protein PHACADRAFT_125215 [Phanerochaete carnosa HHB-10118-sp]|uniref:AMP-dependent synthetase/ligase domain-containing protein n=1 Tax=Phanerochaete carnosa (strain HHB-10118-sp) TaxID=650164 RepID=K5UU00_PHACS|nr:uncharacterized protein PHACADRAFT_125215 [Phanerochaete carnosa HHB-10118-sp]EKM53456.1 hypothetical protein PHACADRAFT_125215 [Phanerochaete carnosa HHB-10118-sp]
MKIYASPHAPAPVRDESIYTNLAVTRFNDFPAEQPAFIDAATGRVISREDWHHLTHQMAWGLRSGFARLGGVGSLERGDVAMIFSPNSLAWPIMLFGGFAAGLCMTLANSSYTPRELEHQWTDSGAKVVFVHPALLPVVLEMFKNLDFDLTAARRRIIIADWPARDPISNDYIRMQDLLYKGRFFMEEKFPGELANETALLCYSSGTTGKPKGVMTTHRNLTALLPMVDISYPNLHEPNPVMLGSLPFYHIYGVFKLLHFPFIRGIPVVIMQKFDITDACKWIEKYKVTQMLVVPPMCLLFTHHPAVDKYNISSLRLMLSGAAPLGAPLVMAMCTRFKNAGADFALIQGYGLTETSPTTHLLPAEDFVRKVGSVGPLLPNLEARLVVEDVQEAAAGEPGELWLRGPSIMKGYLNNPEATANSITPDGWFKTGDIAIVDEEGYYTIVDRRKELIKYKGFQVPPAELESVLLEHPEIVDVAVIGVVDEAEATELPKAYVVHKTGLQFHEEQAFGLAVQEWIKPRVARHKYLRGGVVTIEAIPKSAAGKILRRQLRERAKLEFASAKAAKAKL